MYAGRNEVLYKRGQHIALDAAVLINGRDEVRENAVKLGSGQPDSSSRCGTDLSFTRFIALQSFRVAIFRRATYFDLALIGARTHG